MKITPIIKNVTNPQNTTTYTSLAVYILGVVFEFPFELFTLLLSILFCFIFFLPRRWHYPAINPSFAYFLNYVEKVQIYVYTSRAPVS